MKHVLVFILSAFLLLNVLTGCRNNTNTDGGNAATSDTLTQSVPDRNTEGETSDAPETQRRELGINITDWNGYMKINFEIDGRESFVIRPRKPMEGKPWVWRTEFFGAYDSVDRALLEKGWFIAYHCVSDLYGCPESIEMMKEFYDAVTECLGLNEKPALFGFSRGGLYAVNFALKYPENSGVLYLDAPVLDVRSWPGGLGTGNGEPGCWEQCKKVYHLNDSNAYRFSENPLDHVKELAETKVPVILVCGGADTTVPYAENGKPFYEAMKSYSAQIELILKPNCDHHPHSLDDPTPIVDFIEKVLVIK